MGYTPHDSLRESSFQSVTQLSQDFGVRDMVVSAESSFQSVTHLSTRSRASLIAFCVTWYPRFFGFI